MPSALRATSLEPRSSSEELAKAWLVGIVERTPLDRFADVDLDLLTTEASPLIGGILGGLEPEAASPDLPPDVLERARALGRLRRGEGASAEISRDLAVLHSVLIASLRRDEERRAAGDFERSVQRLAELFGSVQGAVAEGLVRAPSSGPKNELAALPGSSDLHHWLEVLVAEHRRYGHPFALALVEVEGLGRISETYGHRSGDWMLTALAAVIRHQIRIVDHAFRLRDDEFCVLAPNVSSGRLRPMADRLARVVEASQATNAPRVAIAAGVSACPEHGHDGSLLLEVASDALAAARQSGHPVEVAASNGRHSEPTG